ncbi:MAG: biotin--[acetyl-CoA-carboxylase] ligase [Firmicutes bacterium CAG:110_56_8]|nr:MAG: biotin--[acetyl-CoA-carboxylase] ligase [Firmicutes bacterium CAG:110_56_8]
MEGEREKLLALLEDSKGTFFSGEEIARTLQVSRAAVWKAVNALREDGYTIDAATNKGYRLSPDSDILSPQGIRRFLKPEYRDLDLTVLPTAPSTNALVREKANQGRPEGCVIVACEQTDGRGRYGRQFFSPIDSGVYLSLLLRPTAYSPQQATCLTAAAAAAMCQAIEAVTGQQPGIKWVNDIFLHGKKVCGILTEAAVGLETGALDYMVLGAGVNLYPPVKGFPEEIQPIAGSVLERSCPEAKNRLVGEFLNRFWDFYTHPECRTYLEDYRSRIDDDFRLLVRYENGDTEALSYGEIRIQLAESAP